MARPMIFLTSVVALALTGALAGASHAQAPQPPKAVPEAPAMGGEPNTKTGPAVIAPRSNEVELARLANASLVHLTKEKLGQLSSLLYHDTRQETAEVPDTIGTVTTALLDPARDAITFVGVQAGSSGKEVALPWSDVQPIHQPHDEFATALSPQAVADAAPFASKATGKAIDIEKSLMGRAVTTTGGKNVGSLSDIVVEAKSGKIDYVVVDPGGLRLGTDNAPHAVSWSKLKPITGEKSQPIQITLDDKQFAATPVFGGSKEQVTTGNRAASKKVGATVAPLTKPNP